MNVKGCGQEETELAISVEWTKSTKQKKKGGQLDYLSSKPGNILTIFACGFDVRSLLEIILYTLLLFRGMLAVCSLE